MKTMFDPTMRAAERVLDLRMQNQNIIASNIANADTPEYKAKVLNFEQELRSALQADGNIPLEGTDSEHIVNREPSSVQAQVFDDPNGVESLDGNTVNRASEMMKMKENEMLYNATIEALNKKMQMLDYSINEGGGNR